MITTKNMMFDVATHTYVQCASDMGLRVGEFEKQLRQIYPDSCDAGLTVFVEDAGAPADFVISHEETKNGDLLWWEMIPTKTATRQHPELKNRKIKIFND